MKTITLLNEKGGVGKTTIALTLASALAIQNHRVVIIDADPQANATYNLQQPEHDGLFRLLAQDAEWKSILRLIKPAVWAGDYNTDGQLILLPAHVNNRAIPLVIDNTNLLSERLDEIRDYADYIIIDTNPTPSLLHAMMYRASDFILIPTFFEAFSLQGLAKTIERCKQESIQRSRLGRPPLTLLGIQPTQYDGRTNAHQYGYQQTRNHYRDHILNPIAQRTNWRDAAYARRSIFAECPGTPAADEAWSMVFTINKILNGVKVNG